MLKENRKDLFWLAISKVSVQGHKALLFLRHVETSWWRVHGREELLMKCYWRESECKGQGTRYTHIIPVNYLLLVSSTFCSFFYLLLSIQIRTHQTRNITQ
jgi:hypothetical protein